MDLLKVENLIKTYKKRKSGEVVRAVDGISFRIEKGEIFALLGPNGAGKTTTIKAICGLIIPDSGTIKINGYDVLKQRSKALKHISAVLEGNRNLYWRMTPVENIIYFCGIRGKRMRKKEALKILEEFGLLEKADQLVHQLSRGMQQKTAIAVALAADTDVILLDEPTLGLDVTAAVELRKLLRRIVKEKGKTILLSTHDMNLVEEIADRVAIMNHGKLIVCEEKSKLMRLFSARSYRIKLVTNNSFDLEAFKEFEPRDPAISNGVMEFSVDLSEPRKFFGFVERLKSFGVEVESIEQETVNFEKIFMKLVEQTEERSLVT
ncbi:MAG: type transport system ATP-binding protein [Thermotogota bacterium]|nr:type transport system ATP-binding protein [Thermotogota bacterium]MDK2865447.1 type transport system ATP-binding protein [Thermotogota bacterium]HCZ07457.1 ABC transporter ATP-binding protein [Thermotogota bacterium]